MSEEEEEQMVATLRRRAALTALTRAVTSGSRGGPSVPKRLAAVPRMIRATATGEYDGGLRVALMAVATAYVVSPVDVVPELFLAFFGLVDDAMMITWLAGKMLSETERFLEWEQRRAAVIGGHVVR